MVEAKRLTSAKWSRFNNLKNFAKYIAEHQDKVHTCPHLPPAHREYFEKFCRYFQATFGHQTPRDEFNYDFDQPITLIWMALNRLGHPCALTGEKRGIIRLYNEPLSWRLWITGPTQKPEGVSQDDISWRRICIHTLNSSSEIILDGMTVLMKIFGYVTAFQATFTTNHLDTSRRVDLMATKPRRYSDNTLLTTLGGPEYQQGHPGFARFAEAARHIERGCLLDAVVELFTPFLGVVPRFASNSVDFHHTSKRSSVQKCGKMADYLGNVQIWRAMDHAPPSGELNTCVLVSGLTPQMEDSDDSDADEKGEESRWFQTWLQSHGHDVSERLQDRYKEALVYDLTLPHERWQLVLRILKERDQKREDIRAWAQENFPAWLEKYCSAKRYEANPKRILRKEKIHRNRERRSPLRLEITNEAEDL